MLKAYLGKRRQDAACMLDPPEKADAPPLDEPARAAQGLGHRRGQQHRPRRQRHGPAARHRRVGAGGRATVPLASDHRARSGPADRLSAGALDDADRRRRPTAVRATTFVETEPQQLGRDRPQAAHDQGEAQPELDKGDKQGPVSLAAAVSAPVGGTPPPPARQARTTPTRKPETRMVVFGDSDFAAQRLCSAFSGNRDLFLNSGQLAGAAGEPDLDPAARSGGPPHHADRRRRSASSSG